MNPPILCTTCMHSKVCRHVNECLKLHETINKICETEPRIFTATVQCMYFKVEYSKADGPIPRGSFAEKT